MQDRAPHPGWWKATDGNWYPPLPPSNGHAVGSVFIGALGVFLGLIPPARELAITAGVIAILTGCYARITPVQRNLALAGIVCGALGSMLGIGWYFTS